jgi:hypothetical protein
LRTICLSWLWTVILLISSSWVARIISMSHWCLVIKLNYTKHEDSNVVVNMGLLNIMNIDSGYTFCIKCSLAMWHRNWTPGFENILPYLDFTLLHWNMACGT